MRSHPTSSRIRLLGRAAAVALLAGGAAGCSADVTRFGSLFEATDNRAGIVPAGDTVVTGSVSSVTPAPTTSVASNALPPPVYPTQTAPPATASALPPPPAMPPVAMAPSSATLAVPQPAPTGASPAGVYVVQAGDSLGKIANGYGMRSTELAAANGIDPTAPIRVGQKLKIPGKAAAPTQVAALATGTATDATPLKMPQPAPAKPAAPQPAVPAPVAAAPAPQPVKTEPKAPAPEPAPAQVAAIQPAKPQAPQLDSGTGVQSSSTGSFRWPVRGRVISTYGVKANGERNDGINIEVPEGTPIKAAEGGTVIYAGNELKGYGNLVLIKHPNGFVSAYAHASEILVKRDDVIMRGQTIGKVGATGNVPRPQLHFEIREGNRPVDPLPHLSG